jgi:hypothetical protein
MKAENPQCNAMRAAIKKAGQGLLAGLHGKKENQLSVFAFE